jgi:hypothetical protein
MTDMLLVIFGPPLAAWVLVTIGRAPSPPWLVRAVLHFCAWLQAETEWMEAESYRLRWQRQLRRRR